MKIKLRKSREQLKLGDFLQGLASIRPSIEVSDIKNLLIDRKYYYEKNKDVELANICPLEHFYNSGRFEERAFPNVGKSNKKLNSSIESTKTVFLIDVHSKVELTQRICESRNDDIVLIQTDELTKSDFLFQVAKLFDAKVVISLTPPSEISNYFLELASVLVNNTLSLSRFEQQLALRICKSNSCVNPLEALDVLIDDELYLSNNPDLFNSSTTPVHHFFNHGISERRLEPRPSSLNRPFTLPDSVLYLSNAGSSDGSYKYRCEFPSVADKRFYTLSSDDNILDIVVTLFKVNKLVFSRPEQRYLNRYVIELAKAIGIEVVFDYDDLLLPDYSDKLGHVRSLRSNIVSSYRTALSKLAYIHYADGFVLSTAELAKQFEVYGKKVEVSNNKLPSSFFSKPEKPLNTDAKTNLIYLSGTPTHKRDFLTINSVLLKLAQEHGDKFKLTFLGNFQANTEIFRQMGVECNAIPRVTFSEMLNVIQEADVALVPLEQSIFNNCKSNIKYIECGSQGVPVVASKVSEFDAAITHGHNGWLCDSQRSWYETLEGIISMSKDEIAKVGLNSFELTQEKYMLKECE